MPGATPPQPHIHPNIIFDVNLPDGAFRSYARLAAAAWQVGDIHLGPLDFERELLPLMGVSPTQARVHLKLLHSAGYLVVKRDPVNGFRISFPPAGGAAEAEAADRAGDPGAAPEKRKSVAANGPKTENRCAEPTEKRKTVATNRQKTENGFPLLDGVVVNINSLIKEEIYPLESSQQPTPGDGKTENGFPSPENGPPAEETGGQAFHWLCRSGVWAQTAAEIQAQLDGNANRPYNAYLPGLGDVLGWMAYAFADGRKNGVDSPAALVAANLRLGRRCPDAYRPPRLCAACNHAEGFCTCLEPQYGYPDAYAAYAFDSQYDPVWETFWGVCLYCHADPCECPEREGGV